MCVGEGYIIENIKLKHKIISFSLNIITRNIVWVVRNGDELAQNLNTLSSGGSDGHLCCRGG